MPVGTPIVLGTERTRKEINGRQCHGVDAVRLASKLTHQQLQICVLCPCFD